MPDNLPALVPELAPLGAAIARRGWTPDVCADRLAQVDERLESRQAVIALRAELERDGLPCGDGRLERAVLVFAAEVARPRLASLPLYEPVRRRLEQDLDGLGRLDARASLAAEQYAFVASAKLATLRRFPAGALDWECQGLRRSVLLKAPWRDRPRLLACIALELRGFAPAFFLHVALPPRNRSLILEREVRLAHYRAARTLAFQPDIKGILAEAWFLDPSAVGEHAHLRWLNEPYVELGGFRTTSDWAPADAGFMEHNEARRRAFEAGKLRYRLGVGIWPRAAALRWAQAHPEWEGL